MSENARAVRVVEAFVAVGSNVEPRTNIPKALRALADYVTIRAISNFYRNPALGATAGNDFINGVVKVASGQQPRELKFDVLRTIEARLGRVRTADKNAPRTIDLDLVVYDDVVVDEADLRIPDVGIEKYPFVAGPLLELAPDLVLPGTHTRLSSVEAAMETEQMHLEREFTEELRAGLLRPEQNAPSGA